MKRLTWGLVLIMAPVAALAAQPHLPIGDPVYEVIDRLAARGLIRESPLQTRPMSRAALETALIEAKMRASETAMDEWLDADLAVLDERVAQLGRWHDPRFGLGATAGQAPIAALGERQADGTLLSAGADIGGSVGGFLGLGIASELRSHIGAQDELDLTTSSAYLTGYWANVAVTVGRESQQWGPGFRGTLLLTDNAPPFDLVRIETNRPWRVPWVGPVSLHVFGTRLEAGRPDIPNPYLMGLRVAFRPNALLEFALARTAMFGGEGRPVNSQVLWDVLRARGENTDSGAGNQLASLDVVVRWRWGKQPAVFYAELGGEDEANSQPSHTALVAGTYLPMLWGSPRWEFRAEWADTSWADIPNVWYQHGTYTAGYTYRGQVIGHPIGTDARMLALTAGYRLTPVTTVSASYDAVQRQVFEPVDESGRSIGIGVTTETGKQSGGLDYRYVRTEDDLTREQAHIIDLSYRFLW